MTDTEKSAPQGFKTFIGNLAYATTGEGLSQHFSSSGKVLQSVIITRRGRSLGYGFVDFETKEQAEKAVETLNGSELDQRKINVELAKPREAQPAQQQQSQPRAPRRRPLNKSTPKGEGRSDSPKDSAASTSNEDGFVEKVGRRRQKQQQQQAKEAAQKTERVPRQRRPVSERLPRPPKAEKEETDAQEKRPKKINKKKRTPRPAGDVPTDTGLFVANIPYSLDDEAFKKVFEEKGFTVTKHRVVRLLNGRSRGYGFVDLKDQAEQKKAVETMNNLQVNGREISVKVAMVKPEEPAAVAPKAE